MNIPLDEDNIGPRHSRIRLPRAVVPNWGAMLGILPAISPLAAIGLMNITLALFPSLKSKVLEVAVPLPFALQLPFSLPIVPGFELASAGALCTLMAVTRYQWRAKYGRWSGPREILYWKRFLAGWFVTTYLTNYLTTFTPTPEQVITGVSYSVRNGWFAPLLFFPLFLIAWHEEEHGEEND